MKPQQVNEIITTITVVVGILLVARDVRTAVGLALIVVALMAFAFFTARLMIQKESQ